MGIKLDDIVGNKNNDVLVDNGKKTVNVLIIIIILIVAFITFVALKMIRDNRLRKLKDETEYILKDITSVSNAAAARYIQYLEGKADLVGAPQDRSNKPPTIWYGNQKMELKYGYYLLTGQEASMLTNNTIHYNNIDYVVNYTTGEAINLQGVEYNKKRYHEKDDLEAIRERLNGNTNVPIPSDQTVFVNNVNDLMIMQQHPEYNYKLCSNIDMSGVTNSQWQPVSFKGTFDGRNYQIENLKIDRPGDSNVGFFSQLEDGAYVKNLLLYKVDISGGEHTGAVAGTLNSGAKVENCGVYEGRVSSTKNVVGGVFGEANGTVRNLKTTVNVSSSTNDVGGFAGEIVGGSYSQISSKCTSVVGSYNVGGFAGSIRPNNDIYIEECCSDTTIYAGSNDRATIAESKEGNFNAGGFVGAIDSNKIGVTISIYNSYARGKVERSDKNVGGFAGVISITNVANIDLGYIYSSVSTNADCKDNRGGFVGFIDLGINQGRCAGVYWARDSYFNMDLDESGKGLDKNSGNLFFLHKTQADLYVAKNYNDWTDAENVISKWHFSSGSNYPTLAWEGA